MLTACATGVLSLSSYVMFHKCSNPIMKDLYSNNWRKRHCMTYVYSGRNLGVNFYRGFQYQDTEIVSPRYLLSH